MDVDEIVYSRNGEDFSDFDSIMEEIYDEHGLGEEVTIYKGRSKKLEHWDFVKHLRIFEYLQEVACDEHGDWAEDYLIDEKDKTEELLKELIAVHMGVLCKQPRWYTVVDVTEETHTIGEEV